MARPTKHYGKWRIRYRGLDAKRKSQTFDTEAQAWLALEQVKEEQHRHRLGLPPKILEHKTYDDLAQRWVEFVLPTKRSRNDDISMMRCHLIPQFEGMPLRLMNADAIERFKSRLERERKPKTVHNILTLLRAQLRYAHDLNWLERIPKFRMPRVQLIETDFRYLKTKGEIRTFLNAARLVDDKAYVLYATAIYTGMRKGELAGLKWSDVDLAKRLILVKHSYNGPTKSGYARHVPIFDVLLPILEAWRKSSFCRYVFPNRNGGPYDASGRIFAEVFHTVLVEAGFPKSISSTGEERRYLSFHSLRHTFASHFMMNGGDIFKLQKIGGWKSAELVQRYAHLSPNAFDDLYGVFGVAEPGAKKSVDSVSLKSLPITDSQKT